MENAPEFSNLEAVILFEGRYLELHAGLVSTRVQRLTRIVSPWGLEHVSDPRLAFDSARQELTVNACRTYQPDGYFYDSPVNAFNDVTPGGVALAVDFLTIREMVVTHTGLEPGYCIWLDYTISETTPSALPYNEVFTPQGRFPTAEYELSATGDLFGETVNPDPAGLFALPEPERDGDTLRWHLTELPASPGEATDRLGDQIPRVVLAAVDSWDELAGGLREQLILASESCDGLEEWLLDLEADSPFLDGRDALRVCTEALADRTALLTYAPVGVPLTPRSVSRVLETSVATPLERVALLMAIGHHRGFETSLFFPSTSRTISRDIPALGILGSPYLKLRPGWDSDSHWTFHPTSGEVTSPWTDQRDMPVLSILDDRASWEMDCLPSPRRFTLNMYWNLNDGTVHAAGFCSFDDRISGNPLTPETLLAEWVGGWSDETETGASSMLCNLSGFDFELDATVTPPAADDRGRTTIELPLPPLDLQTIIPAGMTLAHSQCRARLFPVAPISIQIHWLIDLPEGVELLSGENAGAGFPGASFTLERTLEGSRLNSTYHLEWSGDPIDPSGYADCRQFLLTALDPAMSTLVLKGTD
ncbi:MAG: DUF3857 domain-containing protein [bacterium]|nr:DUF3857 domain-containing protein [bacterium]